MFVSINFYFRPYEFLCSSLLFFENAASILCIDKYYFGVVKIVSVLFSIFTWKNVLKNDLRITRCYSSKYCVNGVCIKGNIRVVYNNRSSLGELEDSILLSKSGSSLSLQNHICS